MDYLLMSPASDGQGPFTNAELTEGTILMEIIYVEVGKN